MILFKLAITLIVLGGITAATGVLKAENAFLTSKHDFWMKVENVGFRIFLSGVCIAALTLVGLVWSL